MGSIDLGWKVMKLKCMYMEVLPPIFSKQLSFQSQPQLVFTATSERARVWGKKQYLPARTSTCVGAQHLIPDLCHSRWDTLRSILKLSRVVHVLKGLFHDIQGAFHGNSRLFTVDVGYLQSRGQPPMKTNGCVDTPGPNRI